MDDAYKKALKWGDCLVLMQRETVLAEAHGVWSSSSREGEGVYKSGAEARRERERQVRSFGGKFEQALRKC